MKMLKSLFSFRNLIFRLTVQNHPIDNKNIVIDFYRSKIQYKFGTIMRITNIIPGFMVCSIESCEPLEFQDDVIVTSVFSVQSRGKIKKTVHTLTLNLNTEQNFMKLKQAETQAVEYIQSQAIRFKAIRITANYIKRFFKFNLSCNYHEASVNLFKIKSDLVDAYKAGDRLQNLKIHPKYLYMLDDNGNDELGSLGITWYISSVTKVDCTPRMSNEALHEEARSQ